MEPWLTGIINKRPECVLIMHALIIAGIRKGECTSEDAHCIPVTHPNVRGAAMKLLGKCGFKKDRVVRGTTEKSHGHWLWVWVVYDRQRADQVLLSLRGQVMKLEKRGQLELF